MKTRSILMVVFLLLMLPAIASAQNQNQQDETVSVPKSLLSKEQLAELAANELKDKMGKYGNWVGVGHELGVAVNEGLSAVSAQANSFASTPVGKWTMFLIIWKIMGKDLQAWVFSVFFIVIGIPLWWFSYRRYLPRKFLVSEEYDPTTKKLSKRIYCICPDPKIESERDEANVWKGVHFAILILAMVIILFAVFGST